jgi:tetratricopeptide (TPR) repeat protein
MQQQDPDARAALQVAEQDLQRAATVVERVSALMNRSRASKRLGDLDAALADLDEVVALLPVYGTAHFDRGGIRMLRHEYELAIADLDIAVALFPAGQERAVAYHNRGLAREELNDAPEALRDLHRAVAAGWPESEVEIVRICKRFTCTDESPLERPADWAAAVSLCEEAQGIFAGAPLRALAMFTRAAELAPDLQYAAHGLGIVNVVLRRLDEAITAFDRALAVQPQNLAVRAESLFNRGQLRGQRGDVQGGVADLEACLALCDRKVGFPDCGDPDKEAAFVEGIRGRLDRLLRSSG